jgi:hypothetical protein
LALLMDVLNHPTARTLRRQANVRAGKIFSVDGRGSAAEIRNRFGNGSAKRTYMWDRMCALRARFQ